jgi:hypothetical protein
MENWLIGRGVLVLGRVKKKGRGVIDIFNIIMSSYSSI